MDFDNQGLASYEIIGTPAEEMYDQITAMAAEICQCPVGLIVFLEKERQWFKSVYGFSLKETPIEYSICKRFQEKEMDQMIINDLKNSDHFSQHPARLEYGIQFYAGFPLRAENGQVIGSCCVLDFKPNKLTEFQIRNLQLLTQQVMQLLAQHKAYKRLEREKEELKSWQKIVHQSAELSKIGGIYIDFKNQKVVLGEHTKRLFNLHDSYSLSYDEYLNQKFDLIDNPLGHLLKKIRQFDPDTPTPSNSCILKLEAFEKVFQINYAINQSKLICTFLDISENKNLEDKILSYKVMMEEVELQREIGAWEVDTQTNQLNWTENTYKIYGIPPNTPLDLDYVKSFYSNISFSSMERDFNDCISKRQAYNSIYQFKSHDKKKKWVRVTARPLIQGGEVRKVIGSIQDITKDYQLKEELTKNINLLKEKNNFLTNLANNNSFFIYKMNQEGRITFVNEYYKRTFQNANELRIGEKINDEVLIGESKLEAIKVAQAAFRNKGEIYRVKLIQKNNKGKELTCQWDFSVYEGKNEDELLCIGYDISELEAKTKQLLQTSKLTSFFNGKLIEFNNLVSHNFRSHVASIKGLFSLIELSKSNEEKFEFLNLAKGSLETLDETLFNLNSITDLNLPNETEVDPINLNFFFLQIIKNSFPFLLTKDHRFRFEVAEDLIILNFPEYLKIIVIQILSFGFKSRPENEPYWLSIKAYQKDTDFIHIDISNNSKQAFKMEEQEFAHFRDDKWKISSAQNLMKFLGGRLTINNDGANSITFKLSLPNGN
ncbi:GAF domain-containing protein [Algoriphagus faecimaris]|uniref:GAF domain-containing protein n=1 Tax=Algoriphagus faecimaris TaxID=686796 RepID=A0A1G6XG95_9BACT|nr:GAF domain-containing protein [Algoriphagus faecimaris]SDD77081.1 GAF domain-containing protein [Algoriphagus faecimaris]